MTEEQCTHKVINLSEEVEPDVGRLAMVIAQLQTEVMNMGKNIGMLANQFSMLDRAAHERLNTLEKKAGIERPKLPKQPPSPRE